MSSKQFNLVPDLFYELPKIIQQVLLNVHGDKAKAGKLTEADMASAYEFALSQVRVLHTQRIVALNTQAAEAIKQLAHEGMWTQLSDISSHALDMAAQICASDKEVGDMVEIFDLLRDAGRAGGSQFINIGERFIALGKRLEAENAAREAARNVGQTND